MKKQRGLTLLELIVVLCIITAILLIIITLPIRIHCTMSPSVICATNLKGLGTALMVYANDYDDEYPKLGHGPWAKKLGYSYEDVDFKPYDYEGPCTITSSLYLLTCEADVGPKSFICPQQSEQTEFEGQNSKELDLVELWDFGPDPYKHVSYAYHNPYGNFPPNGKNSAACALMADMNPWFKDGDVINSNVDKAVPLQILNVKDTATFEKSNSLNHIEFEEKYLILSPLQKGGLWQNGHRKPLILSQ